MVSQVAEAAMRAASAGACPCLTMIVTLAEPASVCGTISRYWTSVKLSEKNAISRGARAVE